MSDTRTGFRIPDAMWKYAAIGFASLCLGIIEGQFVPNRNIVTQDQLMALTVKIDALATQQNVTAQDVAEIKGLLKESGK